MHVIYVCMFVCLSAWMYMCARMHVCNVCLNACNVCMHVMYVCMHVIYACMFVCNARNVCNVCLQCMYVMIYLFMYEKCLCHECGVHIYVIHVHVLCDAFFVI